MLLPLNSKEVFQVWNERLEQIAVELLYKRDVQVFLMCHCEERFLRRSNLDNVKKIASPKKQARNDTKLAHRVYKYQLKILDSLQLASGLISKSDIFLTSDKHLFSIAKKIFDQVKFV